MHYLHKNLLCLTLLASYDNITHAAQPLDLIYRKNHNRIQATDQTRPNILILLVDEWRKDPVYESDKLRAWNDANLKTATFLRENGVNFDNHYCGTTACNPSRATIFTGHYPTFHGVSQTTGAAKVATDPLMYWLSPYTVPTMGNYFTSGLYHTHYIGKWHVADINLYNPGTHDFILSYDPDTGVPDEELIKLYKNANQLAPFGFGNRWVGPEPEGNGPHESGASAAIGTTGRDVFFADETIHLLNELNTVQGVSTEPWLMVCAFTNPHDICLYGAFSKDDPKYDFTVDESLPYIYPAPTFLEDLSENNKPIAQSSYKEEYNKVFVPAEDDHLYRQLYKTLQRKVDDEMGRVLTTLQNTKFINNTIVIFTSDHGSLVGAHGLFQKFFNCYQETVHLPLIFYSPTLLPAGVHYDILTNHVDLLPTLCGLASIDYDTLTTQFQHTFTNAQLPVGRDLSDIVLGKVSDEDIQDMKEPILFLTRDQTFTGANMIGLMGDEFDYVTQPAFINAVIEEVDGVIWKLTQYYQDDSFSTPLSCSCSTPISTPEVPIIEYEMYNLATDRYEMNNLAYDEDYADMFNYLLASLDSQMNEKALSPSTYVSAY